ncbi:uncharacterized protein PHACADRAFT_203672 [Phanerochaete carnosa HHB-10118-sp]|uniref:Nephrocystin 3-like N-terminal domain-containing protein n=1 Tax=Phanerochaete carnosa (strain HHB-10118-sp) TaxID=650164 RepID=K5WMQ0_PHACS|nr:uncharacterized protein PHACADRAFT_203672 [Phanerochaete carnosa HHB-10118-sp]EKM60474.1 hypothetical protein PHACADRAFT_203672 [Phanerochaete carnosa HHB-10118-sp]
MPSRRAVSVGLGIASGGLKIAESALEVVPGLPTLAVGLNLLVVRVQASGSQPLHRMNEIITFSHYLDKDKRRVAEYDGDEHDKKQLLDEVKSSELQKRVQDLQSTIDGLVERAGELKIGKGFRGFAKRLVYASENRDVLSDMKEEMTRAIGLFKLSGSVSIESILDRVAQTTKQIQDRLREIQRQQQEGEDKRVIDSIPRADAGYRSVDELKSGFTQGTREELFEELKRWSANRFPEDKPKRVCYLTGGAGLGKLSISHQLCVRHDSLEHPLLRLGASFFFVRGGGDLEDARLVFSTLARQLAASQPTLRPHIASAAQKYLSHGDRQQIQHAFGELLRDTFTAAPADQVPTLIVIDGIDECKDRRLVPELLRCLLSLVREFPWLYVFAASRPEPHIMSVLASPDFAHVVHHMRLEDTADGEGDVGHYLRKTVPKIPSYSDFLEKHPDALERLIKRAAGVFIFARITVNFLDEHQNCPEEWFELVLSGGGPAASPLHALYLQILQSAFPPEDLRASLRQRKCFRSLLRFVALESNWINPETVAFYERDLSVHDVFYMVDRLRSVLMVDKHGHVVPLHASFGEFLVDEHRCSDVFYYMDRSEGHAHLAYACLAAMSFENRTYFLQEPDLRTQHTCQL